MRTLISLLFIFTLSPSSQATTVDDMNRAFKALSELLPYITGDAPLKEKEYEKQVEKNLNELTKTFSELKHQAPLTRDIFAPSYQVIMDHLKDTQKSFREGRKDYAQWRLRELTSLCLDCHTRLPEDHASQYQVGKLDIPAEKFQNPYNLGIAQLLVRKYPDASKTFQQVVENSLKKKDFDQTEKALKQLLLINTKILGEHSAMMKSVQDYQKINKLPPQIRQLLNQWEGRLGQLQKMPILKQELKSDKEVQTLIDQVLNPIYQKHAELAENRDVDLLAANGQLSRYLFNNPESAMRPDISFWIGWSEKILRRENFFGSGELFLKQCIRRFPKHPTARKCYNELVEIIEFEFSGSSGTHVPQDVKTEMKQLESLIKK